ncbi:hypothetical protein M951_chr3127 (nucleomorph) [Lotharella oceanica]|uniref:Uncharacterized protein n=1 Tax=Lotharella oceanica TaxID=641309 RepID=A0A060DHN3_9EUKA|nr:hypothetical protein M951_chr3127 [Lotharella oceanica]
MTIFNGMIVYFKYKYVINNIMIISLTIKTLFYIIPEKFYIILNIFIKIIKGDFNNFSLIKKKKIDLVYKKQFFELPFYMINFFHASLVNYLSNIICISCFQKIEINKYFKSLIYLKSIIIYKKNYKTWEKNHVLFFS